MTERSDQGTEAAGAQQTSLEEFLHSSIRRMESQERNLNETGRAVQALVAQIVVWSLSWLSCQFLFGVPVVRHQFPVVRHRVLLLVWILESSHHHSSRHHLTTPTDHPSPCAYRKRSDQGTEAAGAQQTSLEEFLHSSIRRMESQERNLNETGRAVQALVAQATWIIKGSSCHSSPSPPAAHSLTSLNTHLILISLSDRCLEFVVVVLSVPVRSPSCSSPVPGCSSSCLVARLDPGVISSPLFTSPPHDTNRSSQSLRLPKSAPSIVCSSITACI
ncbi:hypothetical protein DPX16_4317 [Anabarilius grahami]|uniref:Uncharacterized protein n=1 Tax=Anabarilius grahami TaxID=495550 RepID=A0A3N0YEP1_ANAGA|nr:hypothetical protein DPX16_4317 [Anabarilius grahami]